MRQPATQTMRRYLDPEIHHEAEGHKVQVVRREIQPMLTISDAALYLQMTDATVRGLVFRRILPHIKFGRHIRFRLADIERYSSEHLRGGQ